MKSLVLLLLVAFRLSVTADDDSPPITQIGVQFDWIRLPHVVANQLIRRHLEHSTDGDALYAAVQDLIAQQKAVRLDLIATVVRAGQRSKVNSFIEKSYPTHFDPPQSIEYVNPDGSKVLGGFTRATPSSFMFRNLGRTVEVEASVDEESGVIDLNVAAEWTEHLKDWIWGTGVSAVRQPVFGAVKSTAQMLCGSGEWELAGLFTPPWLPDGDRLPGSAPLPADRLLLFIKATMDRKIKPSAPPVQHQVTALLEWIETDTAAVSNLLAKYPSFSSAAELRESLEPMLADGRASFIDSAAFPVRSGQRSKSESITEFPYPTGFDPPQGAAGAFGESPPPPPPAPKPIHIIPAISHNYTVRNLGTTVELEATVGVDSQTIDMNCAPALVFLNGFDLHGEAESEARQVRIQSLAPTCAILLKSGIPAMIGVFDAPIPGDAAAPAPAQPTQVKARKVLLFIRGIH